MNAQHPVRRRTALATLAATAFTAACGGGGGDAGAPGTPPPAAPPSSWVEGTVTGFGSVFVGGVRYDDSTAEVVDEDGAPRGRDDLKLGMRVEIEAGAVDRVAGLALARRIRLGSELFGPAGAINVPAGTLDVLGQSVLVTEATVFDDSLVGGLSAVADGMLLEVWGFLDVAQQRTVATRVQQRDVAVSYQVRGVVTDLDTTARSFRIGGELISYGGLASAPAAGLLANGRVLRVRVHNVPTAGAWVATQLFAGLRLPLARPDARIEGTITAWTSAARFSVNGLAVDAGTAQFPDGTAGLGVGARVEVNGAVVLDASGTATLVATKVEIETRRPPLLWRPLELRGDITRIDTAAKTFALRGVVVDYASTALYLGGTEADLAVGLRVEVQGGLAADRTRLVARRIQIRR